MAVQAILGEPVLSEITGKAAAAETVESLVQQHMSLAFRIAWSILRNHHDAEDAVQDCFLRVLKFSDRLHQVENAKTWIARVAWTTALDRRARRSVIAGGAGHHEILGDDLLEQLPEMALPLEQQVAGREMQQLLEKLIAGLPDELRQPIELSTVQELNSTEIAEIMKIPAESVRTRLMRARQLLKAKLASVLEGKKHG
jgi:RNA polymerase sigma-70 factor (ECF subfamily)